MYRVVPELYCRCGDVAKDNGFGCYLPEGESEPMGAENYKLGHTIPGKWTLDLSLKLLFYAGLE